MSFSELNLDQKLVRQLRAIGYVQPRPIQAQVIGPIMAGRDVIGLAPTGTGKTAAYIAPIVHRLLAERPPRSPRTARLRALVLCPTRELAQQVAAEADSICRGLVLRVACAFGGVGMQPQAEAIEAGVDLLAATPGRVRDLLDADRLTLAYISHVVVDEADRMLDLGFLPQVKRILQRMPAERQFMFFTATMPDPVEAIAAQFLRNPVRIEIGVHTRAAEHVKQHLLPVADRLKTRLLLQLLEEGPRCGVLVFARTKRRVGWVAAALKRHGIEVGVVHGDRTQPQRQRALERFGKGSLRLIVATDVAARGLHIPAVRTVVNYDLPLQPEEYIHRIGRAGHGGGFGESFSLMCDKDRPRWERISRTADVILPEELIDGFDYKLAPKKRGRPAYVDESADGSGVRGGVERRRRRTDGKKQAPRRGLKARGGAKRPITDREKPGRGVRKIDPKPPAS